MSGTGKGCRINALSASPGVRQLCGSSITHSVHQSWCHKDWHVGKRQGLRLGCEEELRWPCRNDSVASLAGSFPLSSHTYRSVTRQVSREACCKASVPARNTLILTQHSNVVFLGTDPLCLGARAICHLWGNAQIQASFSLPHPNPLWRLPTGPMEGSPQQPHPSACL